MKNPILIEFNRWISKSEIEVLNHGLNWSNWLESYPCKGKWEIELSSYNSSHKQIKVFMPASERKQIDGHGFWKIYSGRIEFINDEMLIWQNENNPVRLYYNEVDTEIELIFYDRRIRFEKKVQCNIE